MKSTSPPRGKAVGRAIILSFLNDYENRDNPGYTPLYTQEAFSQMTRALQSDNERRVYTQYVTLYNSILEEFTRAQGLFQQAQNGFGRLTARITMAAHAESIRSIAGILPVILTPRQYQETHAEIVKKRRQKKEAPGGLRLAALSYYLAHQADAPASIRGAFAQLAKMPFPNDALLQAHARAMGHGYYLLPNGLRSDETDADTFGRERLLSQLSAYGLDRFADAPDAAHHLAMEMRIRMLLARYRGDKDEPELGVEFVMHDTPPNALHALHAPDVLKAYQQIPQTLLSDFPGLCAALDADIQENIASLGTDTPTWGQLADAGLYGYSERILPTGDDFAQLGHESGDGAFHQPIAGAAVLIPGTYSDEFVAQDGTYKSPLPLMFEHFLDLDALKESPAAVRDIEASREKLLLPALRSLLAYNALLDILAQQYDLPGLVSLQMDTAPLLSQVRDYNTLMTNLYDAVTGTKEDILRKRTILRALFPMLDWEAQAPTQAGIQAAQGLTQDLHKIQSGTLQQAILLLTRSAMEAAP